MDITQLLTEGDLQAALKEVQQQIRSNPAEAKHRILLFQIQVLLGQWDKARTQLDVLKDLDDSARFMVQTYQQVLLCEGIRKDVFAGKRAPLIFGEPDPWIALLLEALYLDADGKHAEAAKLRVDALEQAPTSGGRIDEQPFAWIADADNRIGPMLEVIVNGQYYWVPFQRLKQINLMAPADLRDFAWAPAEFIWVNGGEAMGFIPSRYSGSEDSSDGAIQLARKTEWRQVFDDTYYGLGQRMLITDQNDYSLLDIRQIQFAGEGE
ncbi:type VI secretion system accessory protein TagJ [Methylomarinum sp. Ch1-1]|uniref:Type VI secretion system accessory protein TagJ n=1 Tax=Methylomarinum roseum TaxID=3067653 RepID=A0AAU7NSG6_9GAMM